MDRPAEHAPHATTRGSPKIPVVVGPTAGGKSALAVALAGAVRSAAGLDAEVITADAFQVYRGMDIGTAKPTASEMAGVPHHLINIREPTERFSVHEWLSLAEPLAADIRSRGRVPIVAGGTHLFCKAFCEGLFEGPEPDPALRALIQSIPQAQRRAELERVDPQAASRIHANDQRRTVRALEVFRQTGVPISELQRQWDRASGARPDAVLVGLEWPAELVNRRINQRVREMVDAGLVEEVRGLWSAGRLGPQAIEALGYKQLVAHFEGTCSLEDAIERIKIETRRFAKNQRTWLRRLRTLPGSVWLGGPEAVDRVEDVVRAIGAGG